MSTKNPVLRSGLKKLTAPMRYSQNQKPAPVSTVSAKQGSAVQARLGSKTSVTALPIFLKASFRVFREVSANNSKVGGAAGPCAETICVWICDWIFGKQCLVAKKNFAS